MHVRPCNFPYKTSVFSDFPNGLKPPQPGLKGGFIQSFLGDVFCIKFRS